MQDRSRHQPRERRHPTNQLIQHHPKRIQIRPRTRPPTTNQLRRQIQRRTRQRSHPRRTRIITNQLRHPEISQQRQRRINRTIQQHILRLHIPMHDPPSMNRRQPQRHLRPHPTRLSRRQRTPLPQQTPQITTLHQIHHDRQRRTLHDHVTHPNHMPIRNTGQQPPLSHKPLHHLRILSKPRQQNLHRNRSPRRIHPTPNLTHPTPTDQPTNPVLTTNQTPRRLSHPNPRSRHPATNYPATSHPATHQHRPAKPIVEPATPQTGNRPHAGSGGWVPLGVVKREHRAVEPAENRMI